MQAKEFQRGTDIEWAEAVLRAEHARV